MAPKNNLTGTAQINVNAREIDFVTRFSKNWDALRKIMGIMKPIRKQPGTKLVSYKARVDNYTKTTDTDVVGGKTYYTESGGVYTAVAKPVKSAIATYYETQLQGGTAVAEGEEIPLTKMRVDPVEFADIDIAKYGRSVSIEAVSKYGAEVAVQRTDDAFLTAIMRQILGDYYAFLLSDGTLTGSASGWQKALAMAKGSVLDKFASMDVDVTEVVGFANILDCYDWLGDKDVTVQTAFGLNYIKDFLGYTTLFLLPEKYIPRGKVVALPVENIDLYYIDPADSNFAKLGMSYTVQNPSGADGAGANLIGVHIEADYSRATGDMYAIYGMKLWAEYKDGIAVYTVTA